MEILTDTEKNKLCVWIEKSADNLNGASPQEISDRVIKILRARQAHNRAPSTPSAQRVPLTSKEECLLSEPNAHVSKRWLQRFYALFIDRIEPKQERTQEAKRTKKQCEATVQRHFYGEFGLDAELKDASIMDSEGIISDPRRIIQLDELPQFLNFQTQKGKAVGRKGKPLQKSTSANRETVSVTTIADLSGFIYGLHLNVARKQFVASFADSLNVPDWTSLKFDDQILLFEGRSTYGLVSATAKGMQTGKSFLELLRSLREQIEARNELEVKRGSPPIKFPVVIPLDNHISRFDADVLEQGTYREVISEDEESAANQLGFRLWFEESNTSHFLQMWDQVNKAFHGAYNKGRDEYKKQHKARYGEEPDIGLPEFMEILGGCRDLNLQGIWFTWINRTNIIAAWRKVGFLQDRFDPSQIDRTHFLDVDEPPAPEGPQSVDEVLALPPPPGVRKGSQDDLKNTIKNLTEYARRLESAKFNPDSIPGLLEPKPHEVKKRKRDQSRVEVSEGGSATLRQLDVSAKRKKSEKEAEQARIDKKKEAREEAKSAAEQARSDLNFWFDMCNGEDGCMCQQDPCCVLALKKCPTCGALKPHLCKVRACVEARKAPALLALEDHSPPALTSPQPFPALLA
mmetsp:Transcript_40357/g.91425  ORF Transcript_40357/g.91425 Transcript_40357/m.91425 type:complete len:630 (-) Transcript_40357:276-2165(-)